MWEVMQKNGGRVLAGIFVLCFFVLSFSEYLEMRERSSQAWRVEFIDPMSEDLSFQIQNDSQSRIFRYVVYVNKQLSSEGSVEVGMGGTQVLSPRDLIGQGTVLQGKVRIHIEDQQGGVREIFKIL